MAATEPALAIFAFWRGLRRPEDIKAESVDVMRVSPVTMPTGASSLSE